MEVQEYLETKKVIEKTFIDFIDEGSHASFQKILKLLTNLKFEENPRETKAMLQILNSITDNHHRNPEFFNRIEKILLRNYRNIKRTFSNKNEFDISTLNKRIVFFLIEEGYMTINDCIDRSPSFASFFYPEIGSTLSNNLRANLKEKFPELREKKIDIKKFNEYRKIGENNSPICTLIRKDSLDEFIEYIQKEKISPSSSIKPSVFETNPLLFDKELSLIEYAAFFGSIQIFQYLLKNKAKLTKSIWPFAIHSNNIEIIQVLIDMKIGVVKNPTKYQNPKLKQTKLPHMVTQHYMADKAIKKLLIESIKCHHYNVFNFLKEKLVNMEKDNELDDNYQFKEFVVENDKALLPFIFKYFNYNSFPTEIEDQTLFYYLCTYDYASFVDLFLKKKEVDINAILVSKYFF